MIKDKLIERVKPYLAPFEAYLTGGYMRDILINKVSCDRDIAIKCDELEKLSKKIADETNGNFVELDKINRIYRICYENGEYIDFASLLNDDLETDIDRRDFTINAIMYDIKNGEIVDKNGGRKDFENKIIKTKKISNLSDDYLRMLRAFRFQAVLGFEIEPSIIDFIQKNAKMLENIAPERIHQELIKMFEGKFLTKALLNMDEARLLTVIFPEFEEIKKIPPNTHHHLDLFHHLISTAEKIETNKPILKLAAFLHDIAKPDCWTIEEDTGRHRFIGHDELGGKKVIPVLKRLKFSNREIEYISKLIKYHIYPSALMAQPDRTDKAIIRFIRKIGECTPDLIELAKADRLSAQGIAVTKEMTKENLENLDLLLKYYEQISPKLKELPKLIDGKEIMELLKIAPSPALGKIIEEIKELQFEGKINSKEEAIRFLQSVRKNK